MTAFALFVALCAQVAVRLPWTPVPITGQTFAVLVAGGALGAWRGAGSLTIYMLLGIALPVFAPGASPTDGTWDAHFILPWSGSNGLVWSLSSGGYIVGFILAAALVGWLAERGWDRRQWVHLAMFLGNVLLYVPGLLWLNIDAAEGDWAKTLEWGLYPFHRRRPDEADAGVADAAGGVGGGGEVREERSAARRRRRPGAVVGLIAGQLASTTPAPYAHALRRARHERRPALGQPPAASPEPPCPSLPARRRHPQDRCPRG